MFASTKGAALTAVAAFVYLLFSKHDIISDITSSSSSSSPSLRQSMEWSSIPTKSYNLDTLRDETQLTQIINDLLVTNKPVVIKSGLCRDWVHRIKWTPDYLSKHIGTAFKKVKKQINDSRFVYFDALPEFPLHPYSRAKFKMLRKIKAKKFWDIGLNETNDKYLYYSYLAPKSIVHQLAEIGPKPSLFFKSFDDDGTSSISSSSSSSEIMLWIGFEGITTTFHYDSDINFFQQIKGSKQFHLIAPKYWDKMDTFPRLHPSDRQSQIQFDEVLNDKEKESKSAINLHRDLVFASKLDPDSFLFGVVEEGDMLFLPPFWFHEVVTISESYSVSINIWSHSKALHVFQGKILSDALPYSSKYGLSHEQLVDSLIVLIPKLAQHILGREQGKELVCGTLIRSYEVMVQRGNINIRWTSVNCARRYDGPVEFEKIGDIFKSMEHDVIPIVFVNYVESIVGYLMDPPQVLPFVKKCVCGKNVYW